ncbi:MAG: hypothetical protein AAGF58_17375, partial [Pseudomonadota bacterium]
MAIKAFFFPTLGIWRVIGDDASEFYRTLPNRAEWVESGGGDDRIIGTINRDGNAGQGKTPGLTKPNPSRTLADTLDGGAGNDTLILDDYRGLLIGGTGNDQINSNSRRQTDGERIVILGDTDSNDTRGHGNDTISPGVPQESIDGGGGRDLLTYLTAPAAVTVNLT